MQVIVQIFFCEDSMFQVFKCRGPGSALLGECGSGSKKLEPDPGYEQNADPHYFENADLYQRIGPGSGSSEILSLKDGKK